MPPISHVMRLLQFGDSMLPVGAFSFSGGLESAVQQAVVRDLETLGHFVRTAVEQAATGDGIALLHAHRAAQAGDEQRLIEADRAVFHRKLNEEMRTMTVRMGRKLVEMAHHVACGPLVCRWKQAIEASRTPGTYPVAQGLVFAMLGIDEAEAFGVHQYGVATMILGAALRLMRISYLDAQSLLFEINAAGAHTYERVAERRLDEMTTFAPLLDILAAVHVTSHIRMFMN